MRQGRKVILAGEKQPREERPNVGVNNTTDGERIQSKKAVSHDARTKFEAIACNRDERSIPRSRTSRKTVKRQGGQQAREGLAARLGRNL